MHMHLMPFEDVICCVVYCVATGRESIAPVQAMYSGKLATQP